MNRLGTVQQFHIRRSQSILPSSVILLGLLFGAQASAAPLRNGSVAGTTGQVPPSTQDSQRNAKKTSPAQGASNTKKNRNNVTALGTITVTATGRAQEAITVPYNLTVVTGQTIRQDNVRSTAELMQSIPGVSVVDNGPRNSSIVNMIHIRGINQDGSATGDYPVTSVAPVATYVNTVPIFANFLLFDLNRVEVLRGPQGTLYGSGSLGGTVRFILNKPQLRKFGGNVAFSSSSTNGAGKIGTSESAVLNIPLGTTVALRLNLKHNDFPGITDYVNLYKLDGSGVPVAPEGILSSTASYYQKKNADSVKQTYGRVSLLWQPSDATHVDFTYMGQNGRIGGRRGMSLGTNGAGVPYKRHQMGAVLPEPANRHIHLTSIEADHNFGIGSLTSTTSYYNERGIIDSDNTGFYAANDFWTTIFLDYPRPAETAHRSYRNAAFTQEFRFVSQTGGPFDYIVGLYYTNENRLQIQNESALGFKAWWDAAFPLAKSAVIEDHNFSNQSNQHYHEIAMYGQGIWHATDSLSFTLGVRSFRDKFQATVGQFTGNFACCRSGSFSSNTEKDRKTVFLGNMSWWFLPSDQLYATVSQGYRRGGANGVPTTGNFAESPAWSFYQPDTITNYEVGMKGLLGSLMYTTDIFYSNWKNPQLDTTTTNWGFIAVENSGNAVSKGFEVELEGRLGEHFSYTFGYAYTDAYLTENAFTPDQIIQFGVKGQRLPGVSKNKANVSATYSVHLGAGTFRVNVNGSYRSAPENSLGIGSVLSATLHPFTLWNANLGYSIGRWDVALWAKNLSNTLGATGMFPLSYGSSPVQNFFGNDARLITSLPRTVGLTVGYRF